MENTLSQNGELVKSEKLQATLQADYYGKAHILTFADGTKALKSYETTVCMITPAGDFIRLWGGYSNTTKRHINDFRRLFDLPALNKAEWCALPVAGGSEDRYGVEFSNGFTSWTAGVQFDNYGDALQFAEDTCERSGWRFCYSVNEL